MDRERGNQIQNVAGRIRRRELLRRSAALGLMAPGLSGLLAACAAPTPSTGQASPGAQGPRRGGVLIGYTSTGPRTLDIGQEGNVAPQQYVGNVFDTLVRIDPRKLPDERVVIGSLASKWEVSPDSSEVIFHLRPGVTFHDGKPFTSADVKFTLERMSNPPAGIASPHRPLFRGVQVTAPDPMTAVVKFPNPYPLAVEVFTLPSASILPKHILEVDQHALEQNPVGTGPFKFSKWQRGVSQEFVRNDSYWEQGKPYLDGIRFLDMPEPAAQLSAFLTGQVHLTGFGTRGLSPSDVKTIKERLPDALIQEYPTSVLALMIMNNQTPPFNDVRVRQAVAMTMDQQQLMDLGMEGAAFKTDFTGYRGSKWSYAGSVDQPSVRGVTQADRDKAKALLAEAGHPQGLDVELLVGDVLQSYAPVTIDQLAKIGIRATARVVSFGTQFIPQTTEGKYQIAYATLVTGALDPSSQLVTFVTGADNNRMKYSNPEVDSLIKRVQAAVDPSERKRLSDQVQAILWKDVPAVPSALVKYFFGLRPEIQGWTHPGVLKDNMRWEDLWMRG